MMRIIISIFVSKALPGMKHLQQFLFFSCLFISLSIQAQQNHFIYIQADNKQPFYVKLDKKIFSSSVSGYLILSKLKTGVYDLLVGFPQNEWPEQSIQCKIEDTDLGYLLKNFGDNGWGLFNLQSLNIVMSADKKINKKPDTVADVKGDAFSNMLSEVVNDPTIKQKEPVKEDVKKTVIEQGKTSMVTPESVTEKMSVAVKTDSVKEESKKANESLLKTLPVTSIEPVKDKIAKPVKDEEKKAAAEQLLVSQSASPVSGAAKDKAAEFSTDDSKKAKTEQPKLDPASTALENNKQAEQSIPATKIAAPVENIHTIVKKMSSKTSLGIEGIYIDSADGQRDTISVFIAAEKTSADTMAAKKVPEEKVTEVVKPVVVKEEPGVKEEKKQADKFIDITVPATIEPAKENKTDSAIQSTGKVSVINSDCKAQASEEDFLKLRKKMAGANNEEMMINIAKKAFKSRCFLTEQIKNLATLFLKDEKRYGFFDAAYPFVSDAQNFSILQSQLTDGYYINRFKVMIRH